MSIERQLPCEQHPLSDQQMAIARAVVVDRSDVIVRAKAGSGKTSTLEAVARRFAILHPDVRILYIAFNSSVQVEAEARMPSNVESRTGHSLAWRWAGPEFSSKVIQPRNGVTDEVKYLRKNPRAIGKVFNVPPVMAEKIVAIVDRFAQSSDDKISKSHFVLADGSDVSVNVGPEAKERLLRYANEMWDDINTPLGRGRCKFRAKFDHLRKMWALSQPDLSTDNAAAAGADVIFLDEAQDTPPALARVVAEQRTQRVIVGDSEQAIYEFAGAADYLDKAKADVELPLNVSYRFGPEIANVANKFLSLLDSVDSVVGNLDGDRVGLVARPDAILTRTNVGMLGEIVEEHLQGRRVAVLKGTRDELFVLANHALWFSGAGPEPSQKHDVLERFKTLRDFLVADSDGDPAMATAQGILSTYSPDRLYEILTKVVGVNEASDKSNSDVIAVTAHKSKGLEWDAVRIGPDFAKPRHSEAGALVMPDANALRLAYVAVTRAKHALDPGSLSWVFNERYAAEANHLKSA